MPVVSSENNEDIDNDDVCCTCNIVCIMQHNSDICFEEFSFLTESILIVLQKGVVIP